MRLAESAQCGTFELPHISAQVYGLRGVVQTLSHHNRGFDFDARALRYPADVFHRYPQRMRYNPRQARADKKQHFHHEHFNTAP
jgi:hypothetical protein